MSTLRVHPFTASPTLGVRIQTFKELGQTYSRSFNIARLFPK